MPWPRWLTRGDRPNQKRSDVVEPDALSVAQELLGCRLASSWRRGLALTVDLFLIALITQAEGVFLGLVAAGAFFFIAARKSKEHWLKRQVRLAFAFCGALVLFVTLVGWIYIPRFVQGTGDIVTGIAEVDLPDEKVKELWYWVIGGEAGVEEGKTPSEPAEIAAFLEAYAKALRSDDAELVAELEPRFVELAGESNQAVQKQRFERLDALISQLQQENQMLRLELEKSRIPELVKSVVAQLGLTFGWSSLYFTLFLAWWSGRTPGKYLFRLRVVRLDNQPVGLWDAFERFAGYTAGIATGLFGFLQILWDANRQAIHDKIVGTVVLVEP